MSDIVEIDILFPDPIISSIVIDSVGTSGPASWGSITGTLSNQGDLQTALNSRLTTSTIGTTVEAWSANLDTLSNNDGSQLINLNPDSLSGLLERNDVDFTPTVITESSTITLAQGSINESTASGTLTTIAFGVGQLASQPVTILRLLVTSGPYTITIPTSYRITDSGSTTSLTLSTGNHEISWVYDGTKYWMTDSTIPVSVTPTTLSGDVNDYSPTGLATAATLRINGGSSDRNITGIDSSTSGDGRVIRVVNIGSTNTLTLVNQSGSSMAVNRFLLHANIVIATNSSQAIVYDGTSDAWRSW